MKFEKKKWNKIIWREISASRRIPEGESRNENQRGSGASFGVSASPSQNPSQDRKIKGKTSRLGTQFRRRLCDLTWRWNDNPTVKTLVTLMVGIYQVNWLWHFWLVSQQANRSSSRLGSRLSSAHQVHIKWANEAHDWQLNSRVLPDILFPSILW